MSTLRAGIVGGGFMAEVHSRAIRSARGVPAALASSSPDRARAAAERLGIESAADDLDALLADPSIDVVHVCTPNRLHLDQALAVIAAGKHVICEKPLATSADDAQRLADAAREAGVVATVPFVYRFHPMAREARARMAAGDAGRLLTINGSYLQDWLLTETDDNWRVDDGLGGPSRAFADIGSHLVDLTEFITGDRITRLLAVTRTVFDRRASSAAITTEDLAAVVVETAAGAVGTLLVSQVAPGRKNALVLEVHGSAESLRFEQENPEQLWIGRRRGSELMLRNPEELGDEATRLSIIPSGHALGYQDAFNAFVADSYAAIRGELHEGLPVFDDGVRAARITDAVLASASSGTWAEI
ncbi:putative dehydrogenase [Diaminobutyricimonas aerilata]|uniref:Putative dehydrogenase n=1 Tax=Diaminobutyricimonas aerilata TaxID=1162967 RepID=A0A2M9CGE1_9MICO|nr:Gfo/Idh/MocA family oxidoreductase [Diaminobutyricimonas aerilata]PJJ70994.1 putative dehydrogenase [Diaminobutyricimonas aerilata]